MNELFICYTIRKERILVSIVSLKRGKPSQMNNKVPQSVTRLDCPVLKKECEVNFEVNVFRGADHGGVEATTCSEFLHNKGIPTCGQDCTHTQEAKRIHEQEVGKHQQELSEIGPNVIG